MNPRISYPTKDWNFYEIPYDLSTQKIPIYFFYLGAAFEFIAILRVILSSSPSVTVREFSWIVGGILICLMGVIIQLVIAKGKRFPLKAFSRPPYALGQYIKATLKTPEDLQLDGDFTVSLICEESSSQGEVEIFRDQYQLPAVEYPPGSHLPIEIQIPLNGVLSEQRSGFRRRWILFVTAPTSGIQYSAKYEIPVK